MIRMPCNLDNFTNLILLYQFPEKTTIVFIYFPQISIKGFFFIITLTKCHNALTNLGTLGPFYTFLVSFADFENIMIL